MENVYCNISCLVLTIELGVPVPHILLQEGKFLLKLLRIVEGFLGALECLKRLCELGHLLLLLRQRQRQFVDLFLVAFLLRPKLLPAGRNEHCEFLVSSGNWKELLREITKFCKQLNDFSILITDGA